MPNTLLDSSLAAAGIRVGMDGDVFVLRRANIEVPLRKQDEPLE